MGLLENITDIVKIPLEIGQTLVNSNQAKKAQQRQNRMNLQMADYTFNKNLEMWNKQNEYNSPLAQMQRYTDAGLNKNLIYGQGNSGNASTMPRYEQPTQSTHAFTPQIGQALSQYQDYKIRQAQIDNMNADRRIKEAQGIITEAKAKYAEANELFKRNITHGEMMTAIQSGIIKQHEIGYFFDEYYNEATKFSTYQLKPNKKSELDALVRAMIFRPVSEMSRYNEDIRRLGLENDLKDIELRLQNRYGEWDRIGGLASQGLQGLSKLAGAFISRGIGSKTFNPTGRNKLVSKTSYRYAE